MTTRKPTPTPSPGPPPSARWGSLGVLSARQLAIHAKNAGFGRSASDPTDKPGNPTEIIIAVSVALAESGGRVRAIHRNKDGSVDRGPWQINSVHDQYDESLLLNDPRYNARAAYDIFRSQGWNAWTKYRNGDYKKHRGRAARAVKDLGWLRGNPAGQGGNWATTVDEKVRELNPFDDWQTKVTEILLTGAVAATGLALFGYGLKSLFGSGSTAEHIRQATTTAAAVGKAAR